MARYHRPTVDYKPGLILQLRVCCEGGELRKPLLQVPAMEASARIESVVLVHGFNNHYGEAADAYYGFRLLQYPYAHLISRELEKLLADLFWPSDAAWGVADLVDFLVYPAVVGTAREAAPILADHLREMPNLHRVHFIGHSLGCRVILEVIKDLILNGGPTVGKVCLLAAAVPVFKVETTGELAGAMGYAESVRVLYSESDLVLKVAFRVGQTVASGDEGFFPVALGARMPPPTVAGRVVESFSIDGAGHSDYWGYPQTEASVSASERVGEYFQFGAWPKEVFSRTVGAPVSVESRANSSPPREIGDGNRPSCRE